MTGRLRPNRTVRPTSKQPPMRYIRYMTDVPEASAELVDLGTQPVVLNVRTCRIAGVAYPRTYALICISLAVSTIANWLFPYIVCSEWVIGA